MRSRPLQHLGPWVATVIAFIQVLTGAVHQVSLNTVRARGLVSPRALLVDTNHPVKRMDPDPTYVLLESSVG